MNPLDLHGPAFLQLYLGLVFVCGVGAMVLRWVLRTPAEPAEPRHCALDPLEVALLAGGPDRAFEAAVSRLAAEGLLEVDAVGRTLCPRGQARAASALERRIQEHAGPAPGKPIQEVKAKIAPSLEAAEARLASLGLRPRNHAGVLASAGLWALLGSLGAAKIQVGLSRDRPVAALAVMVAITVAVAIGLALVTPARSRRGDDALARLQRRNDGLSAAAGASPADIGLAVALFGTAVLSGTALAQVRFAFQPPPSSGGSGCSSSSCSSSGCSSSSCGGGCGGGCGGCGS